MTNYAKHRVEDHEAFILDELLPHIIGYARASNTPTEVVAMACFLSLATILQAKGLSRESLRQCINGARLPIHDAPEELQ
ncbi:hypothetical protein [Pseudomonas sp. B392_1p]|uniref:hypothetical protein n=1 Tax=Pseudomonas sp. B392_1p TaxID=3457507 RepID=UPI003FD47927